MKVFASLRELKYSAAIVAACVAYSSGAYAQDRPKDLSRLQELLNTEVTTVSKKGEDPFRAAAAVYVISREDIRRSGATTVAEALRLAPGLNVARAGSERWSISSRGFNDNIANKLLVLIDGRTVYTPVFSGVDWDTVDVNIDDIKQIEVVRGPGGTLWGANAVNGVINIITEEAVNTQGNLVTFLAGSEEKEMRARNGGKLGKDAYYRMYAKAFERNSTDAAMGGDVNDRWDRWQTGFRVDWYTTPSDAVTVQGDYYQGQDDRTSFLPVTTPPFFDPTVDDNILRGGNILSRWTHNFDDGSQTVLQTYFDHFQRNFDISQVRVSTFDVDFQHSFEVNNYNEITWGLGYRLVDQDEPARQYFLFDPTNRTDDILSAFIQDKIALIQNQLYLTVGTKAESNDYTGAEFQPSARLAWYPDDIQTVWGSVSRAVRVPSRSEDDIVQIVGAIPNTGFISLVGSRDFDSEELIAYELGYRIRPTIDTLFDITTFYNDYDSLRTFEIGAPFGTTAVPLVVHNYGEASSYGIELSASWDVTTNWQLTGGYTFLTIDTDIPSFSTDTELVKEEGRSPQHQFNLRSHLILPYNVEMDNMVYYVDNLSSINIPNYVRFDTRIAWQATDNLEVSLVGQNLLDDSHPEFAPIPVLLQSELERAVYGQVRVNF